MFGSWEKREFISATSNGIAWMEGLLYEVREEGGIVKRVLLYLKRQV